MQSLAVAPGACAVASRRARPSSVRRLQVLDRLGLERKGRKADLQARILAYFGDAALGAGAAGAAVNGAVQPPREQYKIDAAGAARLSRRLSAAWQWDSERSPPELRARGACAPPHARAWSFSFRPVEPGRPQRVPEGYDTAHAE